MTDPKIIGCLIQATAPKRRPRKGVLLPPKPGPRSISYRLAVDGKTPAPFNPNEWTITVLAGPVYSHDNLPAMHLATRTMLKAEQRRQPADEDAWIAEYKVYRGTALLYAVADTVPMTGLTPARADAWTKARTCVRCTKQFPRPLAASPQQERYCQPCHELAARERWTEQARAVQADAAAWAREVLDDPRTVLLTDDQYPNAGRGRGYRAETIAGQILADVRVRAFDGSYDDVRYPDSWSPEQIAADKAEVMDGTIAPAEWKALAATIADHRFIMWRSCWGHSSLPADLDTPIPDTDELSTRLALWTGWIPANRWGYWYPEPKFPWTFSSVHPRYQGHDLLRRQPRDLAAEIADMRSLLHRMADGPAPEPTIGTRPTESP